MNGMGQAVGLRLGSVGYDPRALPWAAMSKTFGLETRNALFYATQSKSSSTRPSIALFAVFPKIRSRTHKCRACPRQRVARPVTRMSLFVFMLGGLA